MGLFLVVAGFWVYLLRVWSGLVGVRENGPHLGVLRPDTVADRLAPYLALAMVPGGGRLLVASPACVERAGRRA